MGRIFLTSPYDIFKEIRLAWNDKPVRFKLLDDNEKYTNTWTKSLEDIDKLVNSFWVFPNNATSYYPLYDGAYVNRFVLN